MLPVLPPRWFSHSPQQLKFHVMVVNCADPAGSWPAGTRSSLPQHNKVLAVKIWCFPVNVELRYHGLPCEHGLTCWPPSRKPWAAAIQTLLFTILTRTISSQDLLFFFVPIHTHTHTAHIPDRWKSFCGQICFIYWQVSITSMHQICVQMGIYRPYTPQLLTHAQAKGSLLTFSPNQNPTSILHSITQHLCLSQLSPTNNDEGEGNV